MKRALLMLVSVLLLVPALARAQPSSAPAALEPPAVPAPAVPPGGMADLEPPDQPSAPRAREPGPPGSPYDLIPIPSLSGAWGYGAELVAAMGAGQLLNLISCVPLVGPVIYGVMAPPYIVDAIAFVASRYTTTGEREPGPALTTTYVIEGLRAAYMFGYQLALLAELSGLALLVVGQSSANAQLAPVGGVLLGGGLLASAALLILLPAELVATLLGPHIEVLAYRYFDAPEAAEEASASAGETGRAR